MKFLPASAFWLPKYLLDTRGYDVKQVGCYAWIPWAAAGVGCMAVGSFWSWLVSRGRAKSRWE